jgi:hypothetical protein
LAGASPAAAFAPDELPGAIGLRLLDIPAEAQDDARARLYIVDHLAPGKTIERRIEITNTTAETAELSLYTSAASIADGAFLGADGRTQNELSTWTSVRPANPAVPAGGKMVAKVRIKVPKDAPPGEQLGVVWAETRLAPEDGGGVEQVNRVGLRLYVSIGPGGAPAANFAIESLTPIRDPDGRPKVVATVHNTGGRALDVSGELRLENGPGGLTAGPFPAKLGTTLAVDASEPVTITLDQLVPAGPWDAQITLRSGLVENEANATITFPAVGVAAAAVPTTSERSDWWLYGGIAAVVVVLLGAILWLLGRRRRRPLVRAVHRPA